MIIKETEEVAVEEHMEMILKHIQQEMVAMERLDLYSIILSIHF